MVRVIGVLWLLLLAMAPAQAQEETVAEPAADSSPAADAGAPEAGDAVEQTDPIADDEPFVVICPLRGEVDPGMAVVLKRAVERAKDAEALLLVIDTPGGRVDSAIEMTTAIMSLDIPTIAFIEGMGAISAGALLSYACDYIYMAEGSNIGASTPVMPGVDTTEAMDEKSNSFIRGKYRALGEANGHEPLLGEAMVDRNIEVRAYRNADGGYYFFRSDQGDSGDEDSDRRDLLDQILDAVSEDGESGEEIGDLLRKVLGAEDASRSPAVRPQNTDRAARKALDENTILVSPRGELLTLTSREAVQFGLAESITTDVDDTLREHLLGSMKRLEITPTWDEALFAFLTTPTIAGLLLMAGLGGLYVEARTPGFGAPGIIGAACLALFFGAHMVIGMANWIDVALLVIGVSLILAEIFLLPGFGIAGVLGIACLIGGAYMALVNAPLPEFAWEIDSMRRALYTLTVGLFSFGAFVVGSAFLLPYTPLGNFLVLSTALQNDAGYTAQCAEESATLRGLVGVATTPLRPAGKGRFGTRKVDVVTRGEFLDQDTPIQIILSDGNRYVVTRYDAPEGRESDAPEATA